MYAARGLALNPNWETQAKRPLTSGPAWTWLTSRPVLGPGRLAEDSPYSPCARGHCRRPSTTAVGADSCCIQMTFEWSSSSNHSRNGRVVYPEWDWRTRWGIHQEGLSGWQRLCQLHARAEQLMDLQTCVGNERAQRRRPDSGQTNWSRYFVRLARSQASCVLASWRR